VRWSACKPPRDGPLTWISQRPKTKEIPQRRASLLVRRSDSFFPGRGTPQRACPRPWPVFQPVPNGLLQAVADTREPSIRQLHRIRKLNFQTSLSCLVLWTESSDTILPAPSVRKLGLRYLPVSFRRRCAPGYFTRPTSACFGRVTILPAGEHSTASRLNANAGFTHPTCSKDKHSDPDVYIAPDYASNSNERTSCDKQSNDSFTGPSCLLGQSQLSKRSAVSKTF
jgi:hypothetical protein